MLILNYRKNVTIDMFNDFQGEFEWIFNIILRVKVNVEVNSAMGKDREVDNFLVYTNLE